MNTPERNRWIRTAFLVAALGVAGCRDTGGEPPLVYGPELSVVPASGIPGDPVRISGLDFGNAAVAWFSGVRCQPESIRTGVMHVRVPWGARTGMLTVGPPPDSAIGPVFTVTMTYADSLPIVPFTGPPVTRSSSLHYDPMYPWADSIAWSARIAADTVVFMQEYAVGDDSWWSMVVRFRFTPLALAPHAAEAVLFRREIDGVFVEQLRGRVMVQDWNTAGVVSARLSFVRHMPDGWYDRDLWFRF